MALLEGMYFPIATEQKYIIPYTEMRGLPYSFNSFHSNMMETFYIELLEDTVLRIQYRTSEKWLLPFTSSIHPIRPIIFLSVCLFVFLYISSFSFFVFSVSRVVPPYQGLRTFIDD